MILLKNHQLLEIKVFVSKMQLHEDTEASQIHCREILLKMILEETDFICAGPNVTVHKYVENY